MTLDVLNSHKKYFYEAYNPLLLSYYHLVSSRTWGVVNPILPNYANADFEI